MALTAAEFNEILHATVVNGSRSPELQAVERKLSEKQLNSLPDRDMIIRRSDRGRTRKELNLARLEKEARELRQLNFDRLT